MIIEEKFKKLFKLSNKELDKFLTLEKLDNTNDILEKFLELYDVNSKVRFSIETFDSIEEVRNYIDDHYEIYTKLIK